MGTASIEKDRARKTVTKNLRLDSAVHALIEQAAASSGATFTSFVLEAAAERAERYFLDKCFISVDENTFSQIENLIHQEHQPNEKLKKLFQKNEADADEELAKVHFNA